MKKVVGFKYNKTPYRYVKHYKNNEWENGFYSTDENIVLNESACVFQYAQTCFEGLKAYRCKDGRIVCFRPDLNASRMKESCIRMRMPYIEEKEFIEAVKGVIKRNADYIPDYEDGGSLYLRPYMMGTNPVLGVKPATEYEFRIFASPVGTYFSLPVKPLKIRVCDMDRAAPHGTGNIKAGLNYAMSLYAISEAHELGYDENLYLDSGSRTYIEETGGANVIFIDKDNKLVTPLSSSILPSITRRSLLYIAKEYLHLEVEERKIRIDEIGNFKECGLCGTAAVISPVGIIDDHGKITEYKTNENGFGETIEKLRELLLAIQKGEIEAPDGWVVEIK